MHPYHIFPDAMMKELPGYISENAPSVMFSSQEYQAASETMEKAFAYCRSQGVARLSFKDLFTIVAGSMLKAGLKQESVKQIVAYAADWFMKNPHNWAITTNPETGFTWLDSLKIPES